MIKVLELFSGIGACSKALERLGIEHEIVDAVEIDKYAITSFNAIHGTNFDVQDITEWDKDLDVDLLCHGSPCFKAGTKILTNKGYKNIEDIEVNDLVLTHKNRFRKVLKTGHNENKQLYRLKAQGIFETFVTGNHPYYVRTMSRKWNNELRRDVRFWDKPEWKEVEKLSKNDFIGIPIPQKEENIYNLDKEDCWLLGRYIADGHIRHNKRLNRKNSYMYGVVYSIGDKKVEEFKTHLNKYHASIYPHSQSVYRAIISSQKMVEFIEQNGFGKGAINKDIPMFVLNLPIELAEAFLDGYISGDGYFSKDVYRATSISQNLIMKLQFLIAKVYKTSSNIHFTKRPKTHIIEGRTVNQHNTYNINFHKEFRKQNNSYVDIENNIIWYPIKEIEKLNVYDTVYNLEVEEDNSYLANNAIVHNCTDFSVAGLQAGGDVGSGTRSSLMWETVRIVGKLRPKMILWENVKNLLSKKHKHNFDAYIETMNILGYNSYYQVLNAKDYGIPQNRERVFTVSIRKDIDRGAFTFPEKEPLKLRLKDMLEEQVDEKYYLSDVQIERIKTTTYNVGKTRIQEKDYCDTLCARDWKDPKCVQVELTDNPNSNVIANIVMDKWQDHMKRIYDVNSYAPTLGTMQGGNTEPKILEENLTYSPYVNKKYKEFYDEKGYIPEMFNPYNKSEIKDIAPTLTAQGDSITKSGTVLKCEPKILEEIKKDINKNAKHQQDFVQTENDICRTIPAGTHASTPHLLKTIVTEPQLITHNITQIVKVRKYEVDVENLKEVLIYQKEKNKLTNRQIAEQLNIPQTQVEHYFRTDSSFAIPSPEIWLKLKEMLGITTNEFDESIMAFEEKEGVYEKANRVYDEQGLAPTLTQQEEKILVKNATKKGYDEAIDGDSVNLSYPESTTRRGRVGHGVAQTLQCNDSMGVVLNPLKDKSPYGWHFEQNVYDVNGITRSIKAGGGSGNIPKAILEEPSIQVLGNYMPSNHDASRIVDSEGLAPTVKENHGTVTATVERTPLKFLNRNQKNVDGDYAFCVDSCNTGGIKEIEGSNLRIRKLTPKECWRLMGFDDSDFEKARNALNEKFYKGKDKSSSQLYKQAGNSICVPVLEKIFKQLF